MASKLEIILELQNKISGELKSVKSELASLQTTTKKSGDTLTKFDKQLNNTKNSANLLRNGLVALGGVALFVGAIKKDRAI